MSSPRPQGYPSLARWTAAIPGHEGYVFRRFDRLSARNLQHLESQIACLEAELDKADMEASRGNIDTNRALQNWTVFEERAKDKATPEYKRMVIADKITQKLKQYHEALLLQSQVAHLPAPQKQQLQVVRKHFHCEDYQYDPRDITPKRVLWGYDYSRLDADNEEDLVALKEVADDDLLSQFFQSHGWIKPRKLGNNVEYFDPRRIHLVTAVVSTLLVALLLLGAVISLYLIQSETTRLGLMVGFTILFALTLGLLTNAKRGEIFAGTAAYAAVLVVFVSGDLGSPSGAK